jgi:predicted transcriptional regulator
MYLPQKESQAYKILLFFVFYKDYCNLENIKELNPNLCKRRYYFYQVVNKLCEHGYLESGSNNSYKITEKGIFYVNCYDTINSTAKV